MNGPFHFPNTSLVPVIDVNITAGISQRDEVRRVLFGYVTGLVLVLGITGNILNVIIFWRNPESSSTYTYLRCLSVSDLVASVSYIHESVYGGFRSGTTRDNYLEAVVLRYASENVAVISTHFSVFVLFLIISDRYIAICRPYDAQHILQKKKVVPLLMLMFVVVFLGRVAHVLASRSVKLVFWQHEPGRRQLVYSVYAWRYMASISSKWYWKSFHWGYLGLGVLGHITAIVLTVKTIRSFRTFLHTVRGSVETKHSGVFVRFLLVIAIFYLSSTSVSVVCLGVVYGVADMAIHTKFFILHLAALTWKLNTCANFYLYLATNPGFRREAVALFRNT